MIQERPRAKPERSTSQVSIPALALPEGGGAVRGLGESFESQDFTGTATFSIPIPAPTARTLTPDLSLSYSSGGGNGAFGMGFNLALASIGRKTSNGIPRYTGNDIFILSDESELVPLLVWNDQTKEWLPDKGTEPSSDPIWVVEAWRPRLEEAFARIERWTAIADGDSYWRVVTRDNVTHSYGQTENARIFDPEYHDRVFQWLIDETQDALGNKIRYTYKPEDDQNLQPAISEINRDLRANRYISKIEYGNYFALDQELFAFQIVFDYGEYSLTQPDAPPGNWLVRPDPFSSYRSGFEIRTLRLCRNVLIYHCFYDQFEGKPFLTRALSIEYEQASGLSPAGQPAPNISFLKSISEIGFRKQDDGSYSQKAIPPVAFDYSMFQPAGREYQQLSVEGLSPIAGSLAEGQYLMVDLEGEGLPGILYSDGVTTLQWDPQGNGCYSAPRILEQFPIERDLNNTQLAITSLAGNGEPDLLVRSPARSGYYKFSAAGVWNSFAPFPSVPVDITDPVAQMVDMDGSGRADLLLFDNDQIRSYPSLGLAGFGSPDVAEKEPGFPVMDYVGQEGILTFTDLFGDGLSHRVRISNGLVECWPNLGYGQFGSRVVFENAPIFGSSLDARRLFLVDLDGSGPTDLVYVNSDHVQVYFNQNGNGFSDPLTIPLPAGYDDLSQVSFADINGNGTSCLILTRLNPEVTHYFYDFAGNAKPYLLTGINNNVGAVTRIQYSTSVKQYLEDKQAGRTWATRLFFPIQLVDTIEHFDEISETRSVTRHKYHDGYYDPVEREFRGFGFVETWDSEEYEPFAGASESSGHQVLPIDRSLFVPPAYTRTWFHTGAFLEAGVISRQYEDEYWNGDQHACVLPESTLDPAIYQQDSLTLRQAYVTLAGQMLRQEVYGLDDSSVAVNPYSTSETTVMVRLIQPRAHQVYAVFLSYTLESVTSDYERNPADPRIQHEFTSIVDEFGNVQQSCSVAYPRRQNAGVYVYPEQQTLRVVVTEASFINHVASDAEPYRWIGVDCENKKYELEGLTTAGYFSFEDLSGQVEDALQYPLAYGQPFTSGLQQARLFSWSRAYKWNEAQTDALPLGQISSRGLQHHTDDATLTPEFVQAIFQDKLSTEQLTTEAGYWLDQDYWWNRGVIQYYCQAPAQFFLLCQIDGAFDGVDPQSSLNPTFVTSYDAYNLLPIQTTQYLQGVPSTPGQGPDPQAVVLIANAENDYQAMKASRITDVNGNLKEAIFDPLGMVIVNTIYGTEAGQPVGDEPLADYSIQQDATFENVLTSPQQYLQNATSFFFYDLMAWINRRQPASAVSLQRQTFVHDLAPQQASQIQIVITYSDGFGRVVENKLKTDPAPAALRSAKARLIQEPDLALLDSDAPQRWIVSGRTVYNNKGKPAEQYQPWFSSIPDFENQQQVTQQDTVPPTVFHYDALDRLIRTDTPKGFFTKVEFSVWKMTTYDEDDTVKNSTFYQNFPTNPTTPPEKNERDALDKAAAFYNTPTVVILDTLGRIVRTLLNNLGAVTASAFDEIVSGSGITAQQLWDNLAAAAYLEPDSVELTEAWVTEKLQPYDASFQQIFKQQFGSLAGPVLELLKTNGLTTLHELDISGNEIRSTDPRLLYSNVTQGTDFHNFYCLHDMSGRILAKNSADAGLNLSLDNIFFGDYWNWSARNFEQLVSFDRLQRRTQVRVKAYKSDHTMVSDSVVEIFTYGESQTQAENLNLRGQVYQLKDQSGVVINSLYSIQGDLQETTRQFTVNYKEGIDWATDVPLEPDSYQTQFSFDVFRELTSETTPDGSVTKYTYNRASLLVQVAVTFKQGTEQPVVQHIQYNANSQRLSIVYGSGVTTTHDYEDTTLRLLRLFSVRSGIDAKGQPRATVLQDINYTYDPQGNITRSYDFTYQTVFNSNQKVEPLSDYTYDAIYRLLKANGRQHPGINASTYKNNVKDGDFKQSKYFPLPNDANALENYQESYTYDDAGNLLTTKHVASNSWSRANELMPDSNRLKTTGAQNGIVYTNPMTYDNSGNQKQLYINNAVNLGWNCCENLVSAQIIQRPDEPDDSDYYTYDSNEFRTRKISERLANGSVIQKGVTLYLANYEVIQLKNDNQTRETTIMQRQSLRVMDNLRMLENQTCFAIINYWELDDRKRQVDQTGNRSLRYQLDNQIGSVALEVDVDAQIISYEEYFPYGGTAFIAGGNQQEVDLKVYRYSGKECDDSTGLYYYGARFYAPWLGRWVKPDPAGTIDGLNLYCFVGGNPIVDRDTTGLSTGLSKKRPRPAFNANKTHAAEEEYELETGKIAQPGLDKTAAPHRLPYAAINNAATAMETGTITPSQFKSGLIDPLITGSQTSSTNLSVTFATDTPRQKELKQSIPKRYKKGVTDVLSAFSTLGATPTSSSVGVLVQSLNNLPSNAPNYGQHPGWNTNINQALHLNVHDDGSLSPRSRAALTAAADPIVGPTMGVARRVALTKNNEVPTPTGRAIPLSLLSTADQALIALAGTVVRTSLKGSHPKKRLDWKGPG
jgi:RHS repeat-associated protein